MPRQARESSGTGIYHVPLFRERFKSEPVNDIAYFITLLRYIHQNPVKAGMVAEVKDYEFSSWDEYIDKNSTQFPLCDTRTVDADQRKDWRNE